jgi:protocatechuate 3,4-dioxygenase beta subunit
MIRASLLSLIESNTGQTLSLVTSSSGIYNSGSLVPGNYSVRAQAAGVKTVEQGVVVRVGVVSGVRWPAHLQFPLQASGGRNFPHRFHRRRHGRQSNPRHETRLVHGRNLF